MQNNVHEPMVWWFAGEFRMNEWFECLNYHKTLLTCHLVQC